MLLKLESGKVAKRLKNKEKTQLTKLKIFKAIWLCVIRLDMVVDGHLLIRLKDCMVKWMVLMVNMVINSTIMTINNLSTLMNISLKLVKASNTSQMTMTSILVYGLLIGSCHYSKVKWVFHLFTVLLSMPKKLLLMIMLFMIILLHNKFQHSHYQLLSY